MPADLPHDVQDLISKMLIVDPKYRITIGAIKTHPAFRIGLPSKYIVPSPLAVPHINSPIDQSKIDVNVVSVLKQIGYNNDDDVISELTSEKHSMAKVFFHMLKHEFSLVTLPWPSDKILHSSNSTSSYDLLPIPSDVFEFSPTQLPIGSPSPSSAGNPSSSDKASNSIGSNSQKSSLALRSRKRRSDISSPNPNSIVSRASWGMVASSSHNNTNSDMTQPTDCETFTNLPPPIENLYEVIQRFIYQQGFEFFHPDELTIYSRRPDIKFYISFHAQFESIDNISIFVNKWNNGMDEIFTEFINELASTIQMALTNSTTSNDGENLSQNNNNDDDDDDASPEVDDGTN